MKNIALIVLVILGTLLMAKKIDNLVVENAQLKQKQNESALALHKEYERGYALGWLAQNQKSTMPCTIVIPSPTKSYKGEK